MRVALFSLHVLTFGLALTVYFLPLEEPPVWPVPVLAMLTGLIYWQAHRRDHYGLRLTAGLLAAALLGFGWGQGRAHWQAYVTGTPSFAKPFDKPFSGPFSKSKQEVLLTGTVVWSEPLARGSLVDIRVPDEEGRLFLARLYGKREVQTQVRPGCDAQIRATVEPLPLPVVADGYDPRLAAWFDGRRARGFVRQLVWVECTGSPGLRNRLARLRLDLAAHYRATMSPQAGPVAAALITGVRGAITGSVREAFRHSGLAHMLAISGLHMALFAGSVYALLRFLAALWPWLVLRYDMRKPCAIVAVLAATAYLALSGGSYATQRAYIMLVIFFLAILLNRPAITMRNVLWAALIVLLLQPQAIVQVGFQMSFAAVMALVAVYENWRRSDLFYTRLDGLSPVRRVALYGWRYGSALFLTSLIAGSVTGFVALVHFYQIGLYGLPANLLAMPIFGTLIMPMAPLSLLALPFGMDAPFLFVMQTGIEAVIAVGRWLTGLDGALMRVGASPGWTLGVAAIGFLTLCLVADRRRWLGLLPLVLALASTGAGERPLAYLVGRDLVVVQPMHEAMQLWRQRGHRYELRRIAQYHGIDPQTLTLNPDCAKGCGGVTKGRMVVAYLTHPKRLAQSCQSSDLVILPFHTARYPCQAMLLDAPVLRNSGPMQIDVRGQELIIRRVAKSRLWHQ